MYVNDVSEASYVRLMSSEKETTVKYLAMFVHDALKERDSFFGGKIINITVNCSYFAKMLKYCTIICACIYIYIRTLPSLILGKIGPLCVELSPLDCPKLKYFTVQVTVPFFLLVIVLVLLDA